MIAEKQDYRQQQVIVIPTETIQEWQQECVEVINTRQINRKMSDREIFTFMSHLNSLAWRACANYGVVKRNRKSIVSENLHRIMGKGCFAQYTIESLCEYIKKAWEVTKAFCSDDNARKIRREMIGYGLLYFDEKNRPKGARWGAMNGVPNQGIATPPDMELNVPKIVVWYNVFHKHLEDKHGQEKLFEMMPSHGGMLMRTLYDAMFNGSATFAGAVATENPEIVVPEPEIPEVFEKKPITWMWRNIKDLPKEVWRSLVRRAKEKPEPMRYQPTPWEGVEICDRADFYCEQPVDEFAMEFA